VEVGVKESIVNAPSDYNSNSDQLFKSNLPFCVVLLFSLKNQSFLRRVLHQLFKYNLTFCVVCVFNLQFDKSVFLRRFINANSDAKFNKTPFITMLGSVKSFFFKKLLKPFVEKEK
jgi:hypothetical protein